MTIKFRRVAWSLACVLGVLFLAACEDAGPENPVSPRAPTPQPLMASFDVTVTNLTNAQPLSPVAVIAHQSGYSVFSVGAPATTGLEELAEGGDNAALLAEADADAAVMSSASGSAPIGPAGSETITIEVLQSELPGLSMSIATMLVNTNDAITVANGTPVGNLQPGESVTLRAIAYDAGTEANTEVDGDIPGPAGGGEGFNPIRDDLADRVAMHIGVVSQDDGDPASDLTGQHRFDNPVSQVRIERVN